MMPSILVLMTALSASAGELSLQQAIELASTDNVQNQVASHATIAAGARADQVRTYYLPTIGIEGSALFWDKALEAQFIEGDPCAEAGAFQELCNSMVGDFSEPILLRERSTQQIGLNATMPLTGLVGISQGHRAMRALERAERYREADTQSQVALQVVDSWFTALETEHLGRVIDRALDALEAHGKRARAFHEAGLIGRTEVLQLEVAEAQTRHDHQRVLVGQQLTKRALAVVVGTEEDSLQPANLSLDELPELRVSADALREQVLGRPDVRVVGEQLVAAEAGRDRARADLIPQIAGIGTLKQNFGLGTMSADTEAYVGLGMQTDLWAWGRRYHAIKEAKAGVEQARVGLSGLERGAVLQAQAAVAEAELARGAWETAGVTTEQASENLRIAEAQFEAHTLVAADLLEAETLLTVAETDRVSSAFDYLIAIASAQQSLGLPIRPLDGLVLDEPVSPREL